MKKLTDVRNEKPYYFVSVNGEILIESESITECKKALCKYVREHKKEIEENDDAYNYFIGMYSIDIM